jgi:Ca2+-binding RTX toxin-like protein
MSMCKIEGLEGRRLLSATLVGSVLTVTGTAKADVIDVSGGSSGIDVSVNGAAPSGSPFTGVTSIIIQGGAGADSINIESTVPADISVDARGGIGNDTIVAGGGHGILRGGDGKDNLTANSVQYLLLGGAKADSLSADGGANDILHGGGGADTIHVSGGGFNVVDGGPGGNTIDIQGGTDTVISGSGHDSVTANDDADALLFDLSGGDTVVGNTDGLGGADSVYTANKDDILTLGPKDVENPNGITHPPHATKLLNYLASLTDPSQLPPVL